jgi:HD-like signal output (HDOD) protein
VNSPWFDLKREIRTITHAVGLLGIDAICSLASAFVIRDGLSRFSNQKFDYATYWRRSVLAATAARVLATSNNSTQPEEVFLAALLQDIGTLVLAQAAPEVYAKVWQEATRDHSRLRDLEREQFSVDHVKLGIWLAEIWNLPEIFREAIAGSHDISTADAQENNLPLVRWVALSGQLADIWEDPSTEEACKRAMEAARMSLQFDERALQSVLVLVARGFRETSQIFKVSGAGSDRIHQVLAKALEELSATPDPV